VLICGGGDGLALREVLRFPGVQHVDLVDYSEEVIALGRGPLAGLNQNAFQDPRTNTVIADAWDYLDSLDMPMSAGYHVIICDFTVPRRPGDSRVYTWEWYSLLRTVLAPGGVIAVNSLSPQQSPEAFWCLQRTIRSGNLCAVPYCVDLPTFREHGYGIWSFTVCGRNLEGSDLAGLDCPVPLRQAGLDNLERCFPLDLRLPPISTSVNTLEDDVLLPLLLNPGMRSGPLPEIKPSSEPDQFDLEPLINSIPILHPYHTRTMIETLAEQVAPTIKSLDIRRLVDELLARVSQLPERLRRELLNLKEFLSEKFDTSESWVSWACRLFAILFVIITIANAISPDTAFAKGGFAGGFHGGGGFAGDAASISATHVTEPGFRTGYEAGVVPDATGRTYKPSTFRYGWGDGYYGGGYHPYYGGGYHHYDGYDNRPRRELARPKKNPPKANQHVTAFVADKDLLVLDNGDVVITASDKAYMVVSEGHVALMNHDSDKPIANLHPDPALFQGIRKALTDQKTIVGREAEVRENWLTWVGWTEAFIPAIRHDETEFANMKDLSHRLDLALSRLGSPPSGATPGTVPAAGEVQLFPGATLRADSTVTMRLADGHVLITDGSFTWIDSTSSHESPAAGSLSSTLSTIIARRTKEIDADLKSAYQQLYEVNTDRTNLERAYAEYQSIFQQNGNDPSYEVDYGTDEIPVSEAMWRTEVDLKKNSGDSADATAWINKLTANFKARTNAAGSYGQR
jgi:spermidine synthase